MVRPREHQGGRREPTRDRVGHGPSLGQSTPSENAAGNCCPAKQRIAVAAHQLPHLGSGPAGVRGRGGGGGGAWEGAPASSSRCRAPRTPAPPTRPCPAPAGSTRHPAKAAAGSFLLPSDRRPTRLIRAELLVLHLARPVRVNRLQRAVSTSSPPDQAPGWGIEQALRAAKAASPQVPPHA